MRYRPRPRATLVVALVAALVILAPSAAFGTIDGERPFSISVAEDPEDALIGVLDAPEEIHLAYGSNDGQGNDTEVTSHNGTVTVLVLQNNHDTSITLDVSLEGGTAPPPKTNDFGLESGGLSTTLAPGETATVVADVVCANQESETWTISVVASGTDLSISFDHEVTIHCDGPPGNVS